jgi:hypothetical protein
MRLSRGGGVGVFGVFGHSAQLGVKVGEDIGVATKGAIHLYLPCSLLVRPLAGLNLIGGGG